jgi:hypothetical protein
MVVLLDIDRLIGRDLALSAGADGDETLAATAA